MTTSAEHLLAGPWGLPGNLDAELARALEQEDYGTALALLRDALPEYPSPRLRVLLAFVRFQDALEVMVTELMPACQEALALLEQATEAGLPWRPWPRCARRWSACSPRRRCASWTPSA